QFNFRYNPLTKLIIFVIGCLSSILPQALQATSSSSEKLLVRIKGTPRQMVRLQKMALDWARPFSFNKAEAILSLEKAEKLAALGYQLLVL
ncbi:MAG: hypothetical protein DRI99_05320, partial [Candidatus Aminicenantes bacterium]